MKTLKLTLVILALSLGFVSKAQAQSIDIGAILQSMISEAVAGITDDLEYKQSKLNAIAKAVAENQTYQAAEPKDIPILVAEMNRIIDRANNLDPSLNLPNLPTAKIPAYIYKNVAQGNTNLSNAELLDHRPIAIAKRCKDANPLECYDNPENVDTSGSQVPITEVRPVTP